MVDKKLNEGFTEFANPQNPWFHPFGVVGRFFSRFLARQARGENDSNPPDQIEDPVTHKKVQSSQPLDGDTVASDKVIVASTMLHSKGAHPILPEMEYDRRRRYREYEDMDGYPEISSAFDIYADDCSQENLDGTKWDIISEDEMARDEVSRLFETVNLDQYLWDIVRNTVKYGDNFIELVVDTKNIKKGIQRIKILNPNYIYRVENEFGYLKSFFQQIPAKDEWTSYGGAGPAIENSQVIPLDPGQIVHFKLYTSDPTHYPYGKSVAQAARQIYKSLKMMEDAMLIYRLCLVGDTRVSTNQGYKYIKDINKGDLVYCFAGPNKGFELTKVTNSWETGTKPVFEVKSKHFKVVGTDTHPILVLNREILEVTYVPIKDLNPKIHSFTIANDLKNKNKANFVSFEPIQSITYIGEEKVYDIEVEHEKHNFIANGVVVHNSRAPERRIFYLDTGALPSSKAQAHIQEQMNRFKKSKVFDNKTGNINATYNAIAADEDFYIAVNGKGSGTKIETLPGAENLGEVDDVKYFRDKLLAALKIPKDYIVEKDQSPERKANLSQLDVKFARVINRIQKSVETGLQLIAKRHLLIKGYPKHIVNRLKVKLPAPSDMARKRQLDLDEQKARVVSAVKGLGLFPTKKIYKDYYQLNDYQIEEIKAELKKEMSDPVFGQQQMPGMGAPGMPMQDPMAGGMPPEGGIPQQEPNENVPPTQNEAIDAHWNLLSEPAKQVMLELKSSVNKNKV
jgi:hypothetical protein